MPLEHIEYIGDKDGSSDKEKLNYWVKMADIFDKTQSALKLEKTKMLDQKRISWWKEEAKKER